MASIEVVRPPHGSSCLNSVSRGLTEHTLHSSRQHYCQRCVSEYIGKTDGQVAVRPNDSTTTRVQYKIFEIGVIEMKINKMKKGLCFLRAMMTPMDIVGAETVEDTANENQLIIDCKHPELIMTLQNSSKPAERLMSYQADRIIEKLRENGLTEDDCSLDSEARKFVVKLSKEKYRKIADCLKDKRAVNTAYPGLIWATDTAARLDKSWSEVRAFICEFERIRGTRWSLQKEGSVIGVDYGNAIKILNLHGDVSKSLRDLLPLQSIPAGSEVELSSKQVSDILDFCTQQSTRAKMSAETSPIAFMEEFVSFLKTWETPVTLEQVVDYEKAFYELEREPNGDEPCLGLGHHCDIEKASPEGYDLWGFYLTLRYYNPDTAGDAEGVSARRNPYQTLNCLPLPRQAVLAFKNKHYNLKRMMSSESRCGFHWTAFLTKEQLKDLFEMVKSYLKNHESHDSSTLTSEPTSVAQSLSTTSLPP